MMPVLFRRSYLVPWNSDLPQLSARDRRRSQGARRRKGRSPFEERNAASGVETASRYAANHCSRGLACAFACTLAFSACAPKPAAAPPVAQPTAAVAALPVRALPALGEQTD